MSGVALKKGGVTRKILLDLALGLATSKGLDRLTLSELAQTAHMSKSGVFAHFGSREELQVAVVGAYFAYFEQEVFYPALKAPKGLPRLRDLFDNWMSRVAEELKSGCIFISGSVEFGVKDGIVRESLIKSTNAWLAALMKAIIHAKEMGHLLPGTNEDQMVFEIHGLILALYFEARFLRSPQSMDKARIGFENILSNYVVH